MRDLSDELKALRARLSEAERYLKVDELRARRAQLEAEAARPDLWDDADKAKRVTAELAAVNDDIAQYESLARRLDDAETLHELARPAERGRALPQGGRAAGRPRPARGRGGPTRPVGRRRQGQARHGRAGRRQRRHRAVLEPGPPARRRRDASRAGPRGGGRGLARRGGRGAGRDRRRAAADRAALDVLGRARRA